MAKTNNRNTKGFTLIELLVTVSIIAILAVIGLTIFSSSQLTARDTKRKSDLKDIAASLQIYLQRNGSYPVSSINSTNTIAWPALLNNNYINGMPIDPVNVSPHVYTYTGTATTYIICTLLENNNEAVAGDVVPGLGVCGGTSASQRFYYVSSS